MHLVVHCLLDTNMQKFSSALGLPLRRGVVVSGYKWVPYIIPKQVLLKLVIMFCNVVKSDLWLLALMFGNNGNRTCIP